MKVSDDDLRAMWREPSTEASPDRSLCLTDTEWARLLSKDADDTERARAAHHIGTCTACAGEFRLLQPLQSWSGEAEKVLLPDASPPGRGKAWRAWWSSPRLGLAVATATVLLITQGVTISQLFESRRTNAQLETQLAERGSALSATQSSLKALQEVARSQTATQEQLTALQQRLAQLSTPQLEPTVVDLEPRNAEVVRGSADPQVVTTSPNVPTVTLILNFPPLASRSTLEVEVAREGGPPQWMGRIQRNADTTSLTLALPTLAYPTGAYVVRLFDVSRGRTLLATYEVIIRHSS
jgi:hypothetical protein